MNKIPTIFTRDPGNMKLVTDQHTHGCEWVFAGEGVATRKYDGTCCMISEEGYFKRREVKKGKPEPTDFILVEEDPNTGKKVGWVPVDFDSKEDKWHAEAFEDGLNFGTYELVGPKVQGNSEGFTTHQLVKHSDADVYDAPRTHKELMEYLRPLPIEGLVFHHPDGRMAKIKKRDFDYET